MTLNAKLTRLRDAILENVETTNVYHYWRPQLSAPFLIWQEEGQASERWTGNHMEEQAIAGTIDYYTHEEFDPEIDRIQTALDKTEACGWRLEAVQYEDATNLIHYTWSWNLG